MNGAKTKIVCFGGEITETEGSVLGLSSSGGGFSIIENLFW
jgi:hypothetical protein